MGKRLQDFHEKKAANELSNEVIQMQWAVALSQVENATLKNRLQASIADKIKKVEHLDSTTEKYFQMLADEF